MTNITGVKLPAFYLSMCQYWWWSMQTYYSVDCRRTATVYCLETICATYSEYPFHFKKNSTRPLTTLLSNTFSTTYSSSSEDDDFSSRDFLPIAKLSANTTLSQANGTFLFAEEASVKTIRCGLLVYTTKDHCWIAKMRLLREAVYLSGEKTKDKNKTSLEYHTVG